MGEQELKSRTKLQDAHELTAIPVAFRKTAGTR